MKAVNWYAIIATAILCVFNLAYMQRRRIEGVEGIAEKVRGILPETNKKKIYFMLMVISCLSLAVFLGVFYQELTTLYILKRICLVTLLFPMAVIDYKKYVIPNQLLKVALICRGGILALEIILQQEKLIETLVSEVVSAFGLFAICMLILLIMKGSIGMGDVKLFSVMALFQGFVGVSSSVMASLLVSFVVSVFLLVTRKKTRKDVIAFGPSILIGTFLSVFLIGA